MGLTVRSVVGIMVFVALVAIASSLLLPQVFRPQPDSGYTNMTASQLYSMPAKKDFVLINTHVPYEGEIEGTDLFIPYNEIRNHLDKLPKDKSAKIIVYCMSDRMSNIAARELVKLGYTDVLNLEGGMISWKDSGYPILYR